MGISRRNPGSSGGFVSGIVEIWTLDFRVLNCDFRKIWVGLRTNFFREIDFPGSPPRGFENGRKDASDGVIRFRDFSVWSVRDELSTTRSTELTNLSKTANSSTYTGKVQNDSEFFTHFISVTLRYEPSHTWDPPESIARVDWGSHLRVRKFCTVSGEWPSTPA